ncbi:MAG: carbamoyltransferase C-terminal domain-containing protein, partial [Candidatus Aenigmatarchaeota archaeon]
AFSNKTIKKVLNKRNVEYEKLDDKELTKRAAELISENKVISWFQGKMEWGPRALGNRSILANPKNENMVDILNRKVKHREEFRPFAPSVIWNKAPEYFDIEYESPYMLFVFDVKDSKKDEIPAVTHINGTSRIQTIREKNNPKYYDLIKKFGNITGIPILLNTSFNTRGEPIVCTPEDAYNCFSKTNIDYMVMGNFLVSK